MGSKPEEFRSGEVKFSYDFSKSSYVIFVLDKFPNYIVEYDFYQLSHFTPAAYAAEGMVALRSVQGYGIFFPHEAIKDFVEMVERERLEVPKPNRPTYTVGGRLSNGSYPL